MVTLKLNLQSVVFPWKPGFVTILSAFKIPHLTAEHHVTTTVEKCCYPKSACDSLCYEYLHNCVGDILCFDVCEWDRKMGLTSRCLLFLCNFHSHSVCVCVCVISRQCAGSPGQGQDRLQWPVCHDPSWEDQEENKDHLRQPEPSLGGKVQLVSRALLCSCRL